MMDMEALSARHACSNICGRLLLGTHVQDCQPHAAACKAYTSTEALICCLQLGKAATYEDIWTCLRTAEVYAALSSAVVGQYCILNQTGMQLHPWSILAFVVNIYV